MVKLGINPSGSSVGVMGITFKDNCPDVRNSKVVDLIRELESWNIEVKVNDPWANSEEVLRQYNINLLSEREMVNLDALIFAVGHDEFREKKVSDLKKLCNVERAVIADLKSIYRKDELIAAGFDVFRL